MTEDAHKTDQAPEVLDDSQLEDAAGGYVKIGDIDGERKFFPDMKIKPELIDTSDGIRATGGRAMGLRPPRLRK